MPIKRGKATWQLAEIKGYFFTSWIQLQPQPGQVHVCLSQLVTQCVCVVTCRGGGGPLLELKQRRWALERKGSLVCASPSQENSTGYFVFTVLS